MVVAIAVVEHYPPSQVDCCQDPIRLPFAHKVYKRRERDDYLLLTILNWMGSISIDDQI